MADSNTKDRPGSEIRLLRDQNRRFREIIQNLSSRTKILHEQIDKARPRPPEILVFEEFGPGPRPMEDMPTNVFDETKEDLPVPGEHTEAICGLEPLAPNPGWKCLAIDQPQIRIGFSLIGMTEEEVEGAVEVVELRQVRSRDFTPLFVTDNPNLEPFRSRGYVAEYIPPWITTNAESSRVLRQHLRARLKLIRAKWDLNHVVDLGSGVWETDENPIEIPESSSHEYSPYLVDGTSDDWSTDLSAAEKLSVDVVVCVHNALDQVRQCLKSVISTLENHHTLIIIDDGSDDDTASFLRQFESTNNRTKLIRRDSPGGYTSAANCGIKTSTADFVILLNSDTIVTKNWWKKLLSAAYQSTDTGIVGPLSNAASWQSVPEIINSDGQLAVNKIPAGATVEEMDRIAEEFSPSRFPRVSLVNGFCLGVKREVFDTIGLFDEESFPQGYGEENDFCFRAADAGFGVTVATNCYVYHEKSSSYSAPVRDRLADETADILRKKYSASRIRSAVDSCKQDPILVDIRARFRKRIAEYFGKPEADHEPDSWPKRESDPFRILFVLPIEGRGGGVHSIVQETIGIRELGAVANISVPKGTLHRYRAGYPGTDPDLFVGSETVGDLVATAAQYDVVVATVFTTVRLVKTILEAAPRLAAAYYIQDYEPWICREDRSKQREALDSFHLVPDIVRFAKTDWLCRIVQEKHGVPVHKVEPSLDTNIYFPRFQKAPIKDRKGPVRIAAMVRPRTPRRAASLTMDILSRIKAQYGPSVQIAVFGCDSDEHGFRELRRDFDFRHLGVLIREEVAAALRTCDIFVDYSTYQAFGRTALEAMACGCAVVVPQKGGTDEYAMHEVNALIVDTANMNATVAATRRLVEDRALRESLKQEAISTAMRYSVRRAAVSILSLLSQSTKPSMDAAESSD